MLDSNSDGREGVSPAPDSLVLFAQSLIADQTYSALALAGVQGDREFAVTAGDCELSSLFDLASLTKPVVATTALALAREGKLDLDEPVFSDVLSRVGQAPSMVELLRHQSGALAWRPLYWTEAPLRQVPIMEVLANPMNWGHARGVYSDLGYITAARWMELVTGQPLWRLIEECLKNLSLEMGPAERIVPAPVEDALVERVAPCHLGTEKEVELAADLGSSITPQGPPSRGAVQDGNARHILSTYDLLPGHAGLFGTARAMLRFGQCWLEAAGSLRSDFGFLKTALQPVEGRLLGWFPSEPTERLSGGFHHTGFAGGCLYVEPEAGVTAVMLGHRRNALSSLKEPREVYRRLAIETLVDGT